MLFQCLVRADQNYNYLGENYLFPLGANEKMNLMRLFAENEFDDSNISIDQFDYTTAAVSCYCLTLDREWIHSGFMSIEYVLKVLEGKTFLY